MLRDGAAALAQLARAQILEARAQDAAHVNAVMVKEAAVFDADHRIAHMVRQFACLNSLAAGVAAARKQFSVPRNQGDARGAQLQRQF